MEYGFKSSTCNFKVIPPPPGLSVQSSTGSVSPTELLSSFVDDSENRWELVGGFSQRKVLRQSAYMVAVISEKAFIQKGALLLDYGIYYIPKTFTGSPVHETVALVGIPMLHVTSFFDESNELVQNDLVQMLRCSPTLQYIDDIDKLSCSSSDVLKKFKVFFDNCESDSLLLLNIEPKGEGRYKRYYPFPRLTLPGGTMESVDCNDFLQCALREFKEETHIELSDNYNIISQKKIVRDIRAGSSKRRHFQYFSSSKPTKIISTYFAIRIKY